MDPAGLTTIVFMALLIGAIAFRVIIKTQTIFQYERAVRYRRGKFAGVLQPGRHWVHWTDKVIKVDVREQYITVPGQEVLTADGATVRLTVTIAVKVADPARVINEIDGYMGALYSVLQSAVRAEVASKKLDEFLEQRESFDAALGARVAEGVAKVGLELISVSVRDVMLAGEVKRALTQVVTAQKEGLAKLESARGEVAALRALANAAHMVSDNPALLQLRLVEAISKSSGNTVVFNPADLSVLANSRTAKHEEPKGKLRDAGSGN